MAYLIVGFLLCFYWFDRDYSKEYKELEDSEEEDKGGMNIILLVLAVFWPIVVIKNIIKYRKL